MVSIVIIIHVGKLQTDDKKAHSTVNVSASY